MLEMQKLQPEMRKLQQRAPRRPPEAQRRDDEALPGAQGQPDGLVLPAAVADAGVHHHVPGPARPDQPHAGRSTGYPGFTPQYVSQRARSCTSRWSARHEMLSWGLDLSKRPSQMIAEVVRQGPYLRPARGGASACCTSSSSRWSPPGPQVAPNMSATQQKLMQYLPVVFAVFLVFYLTGLVIYYMAQAIFRIGLQYYITHRFYKGEHSLGRQAQARRRAGPRDRQEGRRRRRAVRPGQARAQRRQAGAGQAAGATPTTQQAGHSPEEPSDAVEAAAAGRPSTGKAARPNAPPQEEVGHTMEWVETTARTLEEAKDLALDQLGVAADDAEFEILAEPKPGCSVGSAARPGFGPGFARRRLVRRSTAATARAAARPRPARQHRRPTKAESRRRDAAAASRRRSHAAADGGREPAATARPRRSRQRTKEQQRRECTTGWRRGPQVHRRTGRLPSRSRAPPN